MLSWLDNVPEVLTFFSKELICLDFEQYMCMLQARKYVVDEADTILNWTWAQTKFGKMEKTFSLL